MVSNQFVRRLIEVEARRGFLYVPAQGVEMMPSTKERINVLLNGKAVKLTSLILIDLPDYLLSLGCSESESYTTHMMKHYPKNTSCY